MDKAEQPTITQADIEAAEQWRFIECMRCSEYEGDFVHDLAADFARHRIAGQSASCDLGIGCDEAGVCYAMANGKPEMCPRTTSLAAQDGLVEALTYLESEARRFAGMYPEASDGRNTFLIFADKIASVSAIKGDKS